MYKCSPSRHGSTTRLVLGRLCRHLTTDVEFPPAATPRLLDFLKVQQLETRASRGLLRTKTILDMEIMQKKVGARAKSIPKLRYNVVNRDELERLTVEMLANEKNGRHFKLSKTKKEILNSYGYDETDLIAWLKCVKEKTLAEALDHMDDSKKWPKFLIYFTLRRYSNTRLDACRLARWFGMIYDQVEDDKLLRRKMFIRVLESCLKTVPEVIHMVVIKGLEEKSLCEPVLMNQILWKISGFGMVMGNTKSEWLMQAIKDVVDKMKQTGVELDTKGYLSIAFMLVESSPDRARSMLDMIKTHGYPYSSLELAILKQAMSPENMNESLDLENNKKIAEQSNIESPDDSPQLNSNELPDNVQLEFMGKFPYLHGIKCLEILLTQSGQEALSIFDTIAEPNSIQWATLLRQLRRLHELPKSSTSVFREKYEEQAKYRSNVISSYLLSQTVMASSVKDARDMIYSYGESYMSKSLANAYIKVLSKSRKGLGEAKHLVKNFDFVPISMYNAILEGEFHAGKKEAMWELYQLINEPDQRTLLTMLRAPAKKPNLIWNGIYAAQRMVVEFKHWVRGAHLDGGDKMHLLKLEGTPEMFLQYAIMCGKAGYEDELLEILPWMERMELAPSKEILCAVITFAPNGEFLESHGKLAGGNWPTDYELKLFQKRLGRW